MLLAFLLMAVEPPPFDPKANLGELARRHCRGEWPDDFQMQQYCFEQQVKGMGQFKAVWEAVGKPIERALENCTREWTEAGVPDWQMIGYCAEQQEKGWRAVTR